MISPRCAVFGQARLQRARPAKPLKPGRDLGVIEAGVVAAVGADDLEHVGVAAFRLAVHDPDGLASQARRYPVARLSSAWGHRDVRA